MRPLLRTIALLALWALTACGGGGGGAPSGAQPAALTGTLAYVENGCREDASELHVEPQRLRVQRAGGETFTIAEIPGYGPFEADGTCELFGRARFGYLFRLTGAFERLAVAPDGESLVYEVSDEFSIPRPEPLPPQQQGFFVARADGSERRRLGPASREPTYRFFLAADETPLIQDIPDLAFSPDGSLVAFSDTGPGPDGDTVQIFTLDVRTGQRTQVTRLPIVPGEDPPDPPSCCPRFLDDRTITFPTLTDADGTNPDHNGVAAVVQTDGTGLALAAFPSPLPGSQIVPQFSITGRDRNAVLYAFDFGPNAYREVFLVSGEDLLQLTNYRRFDTSGPLLDIDKSRVFFAASADPLHDNARQNCQVFSVDALGANLRQLTAFDEGATSANGCIFGPPPGCAVSFVGQDALTQTLVIHSSCDPLGTNAFGTQAFALDPDGTQLRQLTHARGLEIDAQGVVTVELPAPFAYSGAN